MEIVGEDLLQAAEGEEVAVHALCAVFPDHGMDIVCAAACCVPFLLDPAAALPSDVSQRVFSGSVFVW